MPDDLLSSSLFQKEAGRFIDQMVQRLKSLILPASVQDVVVKPSGLMVVKGLDGSDRWISWYSNTFKDSHGEFFSTAGIDWYVKQVDAGHFPMPELWTWHEPKTKYGQADWVDRVALFVLASGTYDDTPMALQAKAYDLEHAGEYGVSHGFYPLKARSVGGHRVYERYATLEISTLASPMFAANPLTEFAAVSLKELREKEMGPQKRAALVAKYGEAFVATLEQETEDNSAELAKVFEHKGLEEVEAALAELDSPAAPVVPVVKAEDGDAGEELIDADAILKGLAASHTNQAATVETIDSLTKSVVKAIKQMAGIQKTVNSLIDDVDDLQKEFELRPRSSRSTKTLVEDTDPLAKRSAESPRREKHSSALPTLFKAGYVGEGDDDDEPDGDDDFGDDDPEDEDGE